MNGAAQWVVKADGVASTVKRKESEACGLSWCRGNRRFLRQVPHETLKLFVVPKKVGPG